MTSTSGVVDFAYPISHRVRIYAKVYCTGTYCALLYYDGITDQNSIIRFRLIPGDYCTPTIESKKLLEKLDQTCTGHEKQSGIHPVTVSSMVCSFVCLHTIDLCESAHTLVRTIEEDFALKIEMRLLLTSKNRTCP